MGQCRPSASTRTCAWFRQRGTASGAVMSTQQRHTWERNHRMSRVLGAEVRYRSGQKIGDLQDLVVDSQGKLMLAIVSTGGWLGLKGRVHAVPWEVLRTANDGTRVLDMERAQLSRVPVAVAVTRSVRPCDAA
jgi:sporulation protein YlmC with PRC-barrel domain